MAGDKKTVLVLGATGQQGGAVARELLARDWAVRALVRDPGKDAARALAAAGADLVQGDLDEPASLKAAVDGAYGVFSVQGGESGPAAETAQGKAITAAAAEANVEHFVYTSVGGAERDSGIPHFECKWDIEQHLGGYDLPATVLRPVFFMDNFRAFLGPKREGDSLVLRIAVHPDVKLQMISTSDIGRIVADVFDHKADYVGKDLEIAADELTPPEIAAVFQKVSGVPTRFEELPIEALRSFSAETAQMFEWFNESGYAADIPRVRELFGPLATLDEWLVAVNWTAPAA